MRRPYVPIYKGDWKNDPALQCCSLAAQAVWLLLLMSIDDSPQPGFLLKANGNPPSDDELSRMLGRPLGEIVSLITELDHNKVFARVTRDDINAGGVAVSLPRGKTYLVSATGEMLGCIYSRRRLRETALSEAKKRTSANVPQTSSQTSPQTLDHARDSNSNSISRSGSKILDPAAENTESRASEANPPPPPPVIESQDVAEDVAPNKQATPAEQPPASPESTWSKGQTISERCAPSPREPGAEPPGAVAAEGRIAGYVSSRGLAKENSKPKAAAEPRSRDDHPPPPRGRLSENRLLDRLLAQWNARPELETAFEPAVASQWGPREREVETEARKHGCTADDIIDRFVEEAARSGLVRGTGGNQRRARTLRELLLTKESFWTVAGGTWRDHQKPTRSGTPGGYRDLSTYELPK